jgi:single-strand DNA-binding protein
MSGFYPFWPRPPRCLTAAQLSIPPDGARVAVAGLVTCRQRPGTAKGVIFLTLEDETGVANIVVWAKVFTRFRRAVISGRCLKVTGRLQRDGDVVHVVAERIEDISAMLDEIVGPDRPDEARAALPAPVDAGCRDKSLQRSR